MNGALSVCVPRYLRDFLEVSTRELYLASCVKICQDYRESFGGWFSETEG